MYPTNLWFLYIPGTQMTLGVIGKDGVLEGSTPKIKDKQVPGRKYAVHPRSEEIFVR